MLSVAKSALSALETLMLQGLCSHLNALCFGASWMTPGHGACMKRGVHEDSPKVLRRPFWACVRPPMIDIARVLNIAHMWPFHIIYKCIQVCLGAYSFPSRLIHEGFLAKRYLWKQPVVHKFGSSNELCFGARSHMHVSFQYAKENLIPLGGGRSVKTI